MHGVACGWLWCGTAWVRAPGLNVLCEIYSVALVYHRRHSLALLCGGGSYIRGAKYGGGSGKFVVWYVVITAVVVSWSPSRFFFNAARRLE